MTTILVLIFSLGLIGIAFLLRKYPTGLLHLISATPQHEQFLKRYSLLLFSLGIVGVLTSFVMTKTFALWFIGISLILSMLFSFQLLKKMSH